MKVVTYLTYGTYGDTLMLDFVDPDDDSAKDCSGWTAIKLSLVPVDDRTDTPLLDHVTLSARDANDDPSGTGDWTDGKGKYTIQSGDLPAASAGTHGKRYFSVVSWYDANGHAKDTEDPDWIVEMIVPAGTP